MNKAIFMGAAAALFAAALPTQAVAAIPACDVTDISPTTGPFTPFNSFDCSGFVEGQAFANSAQSTAILQGLLDDLFGIGVKSAASLSYLKLNGLPSTTHSYDFTTAPFNTVLNGMTLIGFHFGGGTGSPGEVGGLRGHDTSALYLFDAGTDLSTLYWKYSAISDVVLISTTPPSVPEPATWGMMIAGLGAVGFAMRRRKATVSFA